MHLSMMWQSRIDALDFAFQPVVNAHSGLTFGVEAYLRGVEGIGFTHIYGLLEAAFAEGVLAEVEHRIRRLTIAKFKQIANCDGLKLFLNMDLRSLETAEPDQIFFDPEGRETGLPPSSLVLELSERDIAGTTKPFSQILALFEKRAAKLALDEFGQGLSGLKLCYEFRPDLIKIDQFFLRGIDQDTRKRIFVSSIIALARALGVTVVAKGIETEAEMRICAELGCDLAQGHFIGRPTLETSEIAPLYPVVATTAVHARRAQIDAGAITSQLEQLPTVPVDTHLLDVLNVFGQHSELAFIPVLGLGGEPIGIVRERDIKTFVYNAYGRAILSNKSVKRDVSRWVRRCPTVEIHARIDEFVTAYAADAGNEGLLVVENAKLVGFLSSRALLGIVSERNIATARDQNPLTKLPGNQLIIDTLSRALAEPRIGYALAYFDFDHFKPFNDTYGFRQGDRAIMLFANLMVKMLPTNEVFVGHVGGDDFFAAFRGQSAEDVCVSIRDLLDAFAKDIESFYDQKARGLGYLLGKDRQGEERRFPLMRVSCAMLDLKVGRPVVSVDSLSEQLADLKKQAKDSPEGLVIAAMDSAEPQLRAAI